MPNSVAPCPSLTLGDAIRGASARLRDCGVENATRDARLLAAAACGLSQEHAIAFPERRLTEAEADLLDTFAARRIKGEPVSRILGWREFWGLPFRISAATLDPRPETELLVETALDHVTAHGRRNDRLRILDLGTGSGCLLAALLSELPNSQGIGLDRSIAALRVAEENLSRLRLRDRASFLCADWADALSGALFDVVVCNPPYIKSDVIRALSLEVRNYDPPSALDGGPDGFQAFGKIVRSVPYMLREGAIIVLETGYGQAKSVASLLIAENGAEAQFEVSIATDLGGIERAVAGVRHSAYEKFGPKKKIGNSVCSGYGLGEKRLREPPRQVGKNE